MTSPSEASTPARGVYVLCADGRSARGQMMLTPLDRSARLRRAGKSLAAAWAVAFATIFVPILHFVLVPGFLAFGLYLFVKVSRRQTAPSGGIVPCPACEAPLPVVPEILDGPRRDACPGCRIHYRMELEEAR